MSLMTRVLQYDGCFDGWRLGCCLGTGSNGRSAVFEVRREKACIQETAALKVVSLTLLEQDYRSLSPEEKEAYSHSLQKIKEKELQEVKLMYLLRGNTNIVSYQDWDTREWTDETSFGCDLLILMERLNCLREDITQGVRFSETQILKLGRDICTGLELCHSKNILHRDIKPHNIFYNADGSYKLGDFGISRILAEDPSAMTQTRSGTPPYAAPEQMEGKRDKRSDIYSLGLVLYELANRNRLPFCEDCLLSEASARRLAGEKLPLPKTASAELARILLKACAYDPEERYQTVAEFGEALNRLYQLRTPGSSAWQDSLREEPDTLDKIPERDFGGAETAAALDHGRSRLFCQSQASPVEISQCREKAEYGDPEAQVMLGAAYEEGDGVPQSDTQAVQWYRRAAQKGNAQAQHNLGLCYYLGKGVDRDLEMAVKLFRKAAEQGNPMGQDALGMCCSRGIGMPRNPEMAAELFQKSAQQGDPYGQYHLGECCEDGDGVPRDLSQAVYWYRKSAEQGNANAQYALGFCCETGTGLPQDFAQAVTWHRKAAEQGHIQSVYHLGNCYFNGTGVPMDRARAAALFRKAAEQGNADAQLCLGLCYASGLGIERDPEQMRYWYEKAAQGDNPEAMFRLGNSFSAEGQENLAAFWLNRAAQQGHAKAQNWLGCIYIQGAGVPADADVGFVWIRKAARQNLPEAMKNLAVCYRDGIGTEPDAELAAHWFRRAENS